MEPININDVINSLNGTSKNITCNEIKDIITDSRHVTDGCAFVAIKGKNFDGHDFIQSAIEKGASVIITEKEQPKIPQIVVKDTIEALLNLASLNRNRFSGLLVGITGSVGKTTTKEMVAKVLSSEMNVLKTKKNLNDEIGFSKTLLNLNSSHEAAVIEMGMCNAGDITILSKPAKPTIGIITTIGTSHIKNFESRDGILKAKLEILDGMPKGSTLIINGDNDKLKNLNLKEYKIIKCGVENANCDYHATNIKITGFKTEFDVKYKGNTAHIVLPTVGTHNVINALYGFAVGIIAKIDPSKIATALGEYEPVGMRQKIFNVDGITVIGDCYNASPESTKAAITILSKIPCKRKRIAVLGDMLELGDISVKAHEDIGSFAANLKIDSLYCYGENAKHICIGAINYFKDSEKDSNMQIEHFQSKEDLINKLKSEIKTGDSVIFKASRLMKFENIITSVFSCISI